MSKEREFLKKLRYASLLETDLRKELDELLAQPEQEPVAWKESVIELQTLVKDFFENYLDAWEESDSGREFHPITISCCRCMRLEPLNVLLTRMRELSGAKPPYEIGSSM